MSESVRVTEKDGGKRRNTEFWRACQYLYPHRRIVVASILCALVVGAAFTSSLGTMLPVFKVMLSGQSVSDWVGRHIVEKRLGVSLGATRSDDGESLRLDVVEPNSAAQSAGLKPGDVLRTPHTLDDLTNEAAGELNVSVNDRPTQVSLPQVPGYLATGHRLSKRLPQSPVAAIAAVLAAIAALTVFGNVMRFFQEYLSDKAATLAVNDIRRQLYDHVLHVPLGFFGLKGTSDVTSRLTQDSQGLQDGFKTVLGQTIQEPIKAAMAFGLALFFSWKLTLFLALFLPLAVVVIRKFGKKMRRASRKALQESSSMLGQIEGSLIGIRVVKAHAAERFERRRYRSIVSALVGQQLKMSRIDAFNSSVMETLNLLLFAAVVLYASYLVHVAKTLEPSTVLVVIGCLIGIGESMRRLGKVSNVLARSNAAAGRIFEAMDVPVERRRRKADKGNPQTKGDRANNDLGMADEASGAHVVIGPVKREVRFENVTFSYPGASGPAVDGVSLTVPKGKCVAIVGRNGSGKTTLLALLPRFYDPQSGRISIDGVDIRQATLRSLRKQIGIVTQDSVIFPGTIAENIAYGQPRADRAGIEKAAKLAFAHEFILEKPNGYDTIIGEHGASLSGGQKQRICIARAILRDTPILILDEATSQVDAESEHLIQQAIDRLMHERTTFVIAHRFSTILSADTIVVMERGQLLAQGSHETLLDTCPLYRQLYERQMVGAEEK
jgi:ATP-binding cassette, subfamily B, bacterial MsbA